LDQLSLSRSAVAVPGVSHVVKISRSGEVTKLIE